MKYTHRRKSKNIKASFFKSTNKRKKKLLMKWIFVTNTMCLFSELEKKREIGREAHTEKNWNFFCRKNFPENFWLFSFWNLKIFFQIKQNQLVLYTRGFGWVFLYEKTIVIIVIIIIIIFNELWEKTTSFRKENRIENQMIRFVYDSCNGMCMTSEKIRRKLSLRERERERKNIIHINEATVDVYRSVVFFHKKKFGIYYV